MSSLPQSIIDRVHLNLVEMELYGKKDAILWNNFQNQRNNEHFCNVTIKCNKQTFNAHKCVLASVSKFYEIMFTTQVGHGSDQSQQVSQLNMFAEETIAVSLDIIYHQQVSKDKEIDIEDLLKFAGFLQSEFLIDILIMVIRPMVLKDNVQLWYDIGVQCGIEKLISLTYCFMMKNCRELTTDLEFDVVNYYMYDREVAVFTDFTSFHIFDWVTKSCERYEDFDHDYEESVGPLSQSLLPDDQEKAAIFFVRKGNIYQVYDNGKGYIHLVMYDSRLQRYTFRHGFSLQKMLPENDEYLDFVAYADYDSSNYLYMIFNCRTISRVCRFNVVKNRLDDGYFDLPYFGNLHFLQSGDFGILLYRDCLNIYHVRHCIISGNASRITISPTVVTESGYRHITDYFRRGIRGSYGSHPVSLNGEIYVVVKHPDSNTLNMFLLDVVLPFNDHRTSIQWKLLYSLPNYSLRIFPFSYEGTLFVVLNGCCRCVVNIDVIPCVADSSKVIPCSCEENNSGSYVFYYSSQDMMMKKCSGLFNQFLPESHWRHNTDRWSMFSLPLYLIS